MGLTAFQIVLAAISLCGTFLNARGNRIGFLFWIFGNAGWIGIAWIKGIPVQAVLFTVYLALAIYGFWKWSAKKPLQKQTAQ